MTVLLAQKLMINGQELDGPLKIGGSSNFTLADIISKILSFMIPIALILLFFALVWGGFDLISSQGSADKIKSARTKITTAIIGFILLLVSIGLVKLISYIFGLNSSFL